jgi:hypothetical protein
MLGEAVRLSIAAEARFKPGISFATFVSYRLRELHRFAESYDGHQQVAVYEAPEAKAKRLAEERGENPEPINFKGNGPRLIFDWQSIDRRRVVFGLQIRSAINALGLANRLQELRAWIPGRKDGVALGRFRAVTDHLARRQREGDDEAAKRAAGDHAPTFLEAEPLTHAQSLGPKQPPKFAPESLPVLSLDEVIGQDEDGNDLTQHDIIAAPVQRPPEIDPLKAIEGVPLAGVEKDVVVETILGKPFSLPNLAAKLKMTKSGASKVWARAIKKIAEK